MGPTSFFCLLFYMRFHSHVNTLRRERENKSWITRLTWAGVMGDQQRRRSGRCWQAQSSIGRIFWFVWLMIQSDFLNDTFHWRILHQFILHSYKFQSSKLIRYNIYWPRFWNPDRSLNRKKKRFKVFKVEPRLNRGRTVMTS